MQTLTRKEFVGGLSASLGLAGCRSFGRRDRQNPCEPLLAADGTFSVACVNCGAHGYGDGKTSRAEYEARWNRLFDGQGDAVFFLEDAVPSRDPKSCLLSRCESAPLSEDIVTLAGEEGGRTTPRRYARRLVYSIGGRRVAFYGVHLVAESHIGPTRGPDGRSASQRLRRRQFEGLLADAARYDESVFCGDFNAQTPDEYAVFVQAGCGLANCSPEWGTHATLRNIPADNIIVTSGVEIVDFALLRDLGLDTDHLPLKARLRIR